ncbi:hypothetical protein [Phaeobacter piscinae]|uniref:hypothetical protein n=1 Tax=Phaeobacter piscinae TaxID=1580596 RepID=UPI00058CCDFE|nr:hypothetical protein [Phaeobacter piscinae]UTS79642.1 hypothetical protein OL67_000690 [Phaeobacter piscinae]
MTMNASKTHSNRHQQGEKLGKLEINRLAIAVFLAALSGFTFAQHLGAFSRTDLQEIPPWLTVLSSIAATFISGIAVYLVAQTLNATRETLAATKAMVDDTRRIGETEIRAHLNTARATARVKSGKILTEVEVKNIGRTPATSVSVKVNLILKNFRNNIDYPIGKQMLKIFYDIEASSLETNEFDHGAINPSALNHDGLILELTIDCHFVDIFGYTRRSNRSLWAQLSADPEKTIIHNDIAFFPNPKDAFSVLNG